jgi:Tfp pilus assembly protein PilF
LAAAWYWHPRTAESPQAAEPRPVTFSRDIAPIVFAKCAPCHHPGEAAPFSLLTYDDVHRRVRQIAAVSQKRLMPPWLPRDGFGDFANARRLTDQELQTIRQWVDAGSPRGEDADQPAAPAFTGGWQMGTPDLVLETPAYTLKSADRDVFRNFVIPVPLAAPRWVRSMEIRADNPRVTHHARLGVDSSNESIRRQAEEKEPGYPGMAWGQDPDGQLVIWAPGLVAEPGTPGVAWRLYPQTYLVLHAHLQPSGKPEVVKFRIGIHFANKPPDQFPAMLRVGTGDIDIPAGAKHHTVHGEYVLPVDVDVHTAFPHAHSLCTELRLVAERPDGSTEPLIAIDHFDENWHDLYRYRRPVRLPRGTRLVSTFAYDNTDDNPRNRQRPARRTVYGFNATDEMADIYLQVTPVHADQRAVLMEQYRRYELQTEAVGFRRALELAPDAPWNLEGLAACHVGLGEPGTAVSILERRLRTGSKGVFPMVSLGMAQLAAGDPVRAEAQEREALALDGEYALAWLGLGKSLAAQKKAEPAEQAFRRAAELAPGLAEAWLSVADFRMQRGDLDKAKEACASAAAATPDAATVYLKLADIAARQKNWDECLRQVEAARRLAPYTHPPKVVVAVFCMANGEPARGERLLQEARTEWPTHPVPSLMLGQLARRQRQWQAARNYYAAAAALPVPDNWPESHRRRFLVLLHSERFQLAQQLQDLVLARDALTAWQKCDPGNPQVAKMLAELPAAAGR